MTSNDSQVPWTDEQWARVNQVVQEEAARARVGATFLPLFGPLPGSTDFIRAERYKYNGAVSLEDTDTIKLPTLQVKIHIRGAQMADPDMASVLAMFRRAANVLARLEDALVFNGQPDQGTPQGAPGVGQILGGQPSRGLLAPDSVLTGSSPPPVVRVDPGDAESLVKGVSDAIGKLERDGHFGPFAAVLGPGLFLLAQTPTDDSLVLPQDRVIPFLGGGSLLRSSTLDDNKGVVVALGGAPVELVVATDMSITFLQITTEPTYVFRVYEKLALRIKEPNAIATLLPTTGRSHSAPKSK